VSSGFRVLYPATGTRPAWGLEAVVDTKAETFDFGLDI